MLCAGQWARQLGAMAASACRSFRSSISTWSPSRSPASRPTCRRCAIPTGSPTTRRRSAGSSWAATSRTRFPGPTTASRSGFNFQLLDADWDHFEPLMELALGARAGARDGRRQAADQRPGELHARRQLHPRRGAGVRGFFVGAGFNAFGIAAGGGAGMALAEWIANGRAALRPLARRHPPLRPPTATSTGSASGRSRPTASTTPSPGRSRSTQRPAAAVARRSTTGSRRRARASARSSAGSAPTGSPTARRDAARRYTFGRPNWFDAVGREHRACREAAALFDQTSFAKFLLVGRDAEAALSLDLRQRRDASRRAASSTRRCSTHAAASSATSPSRASPPTAFYIVTGTGFATHDFDWIRRNIPAGLDAHLVDVTIAPAVLTLMGPRARDCSARSPRDDVSNAAFPFGTRAGPHASPARRCIALRVTYVGELGWELHVPIEFAASGLRCADGGGPPHGLVNAGYRAIESAAAGEGLSGLGRRHRPRPHAARGGPRLGGEAERARRLPRPRGAAASRHGEASRSGSPASLDDPRRRAARAARRSTATASASAGCRAPASATPSTARSATATCAAPASTADCLRAGRYELEVAGDRHPAELHLEPLYDPASRRVRA